MTKNSYVDNGILISQKSLHCGDKVKVSYNGLLVKEGAQNIFLYVGFGDEWENSSLIPMKLEEGMFSAEIDVLDSNCLGICFKDSAENWDNNSGENYVFKISVKAAKSKTVKPKTSKPKISKEKASKVSAKQSK